MYIYVGVLRWVCRWACHRLPNEIEFYLEHAKRLLKVIQQPSPAKPFKMKGIVVFDDRSDLAFYSLDKEMERYIKERVRQLEGEAAPSSVSPRTHKLYIKALIYILV